MLKIALLLALLMSTPAYGQSLLERPPPPEPVPGECVTTYGLQIGLAVPEEFLNRQDFVPNCSAIAVPMSDYADLLQTERWAKALHNQYRLDIMQLQMERDHYKRLYNMASAPTPWHQKPSAQRAAGGVTVLLVVLATGAVYSAAYRMHQ
jgi:hypothetical protein